jgi:hypothetical protein
MPACDAILHPAIFLNQMDPEFHSVSLLLALGLFHFVGVALSRWGGRGANERGERERGNECGRLSRGYPPGKLNVCSAV